MLGLIGRFQRAIMPGAAGQLDLVLEFARQACDTPPFDVECAGGVCFQSERRILNA